jgi:hypothetical protein
MKNKENKSKFVYKSEELFYSKRIKKKKKGNEVIDEKLIN